MPNQPDIAVLERPGDGRGPLLVCEHASNHIPPEFANLGLDAAVRQGHIAWDPGALDLARALLRRLGGTLIHATVSRLLYDLNRPPEAPAAVPEQSEIHAIPGNLGLGAAARAERAARFYRPWAAALEAALSPAPVAMITIHSFTPVYFGVPRPTRLGILHDADSRLADAMLDEAARAGVPAERNRPYGPEDGVTHTLRAFAQPRGIANVMIEVRNDLLGDGAGIEAMAETLGALLDPAIARLRQTEGQVH